MDYAELRDVVIRLAKLISRDPELIIEESQGQDSNPLWRLSTPRGTALLIGKQGKNWIAFQRIVAAASYATGTTPTLMLIDPRENYNPYKSDLVEELESGTSDRR